MERDDRAAQMQALERFVAENDELLELEERIGRFNVFDALNIARKEIRHSNFLAWLLTPDESHGQGDRFLKAILMDIIRKSREQRRPPPISVVDLDGADLHRAEVRREWKNIDLLIDLHEPDLLVVIENKVDSSEHSNQLSRYEQTIRERFGKRKLLFVFLTTDGDDARDNDWTAYSYGDLHRVLTRVRAQAGGVLGADVGVFLDHYLNLVRSRFMNDDVIDDLCLRIYRNHPRAIEILFERVDIGGSGVGSAVGRYFLQRLEQWHVMYNQPKYVKVYPKSWIGTLCDKDGEPTVSGVDLFFEFQVTDDALKMRCVVGLARDAERRLRIIRRLSEEPKEFGFRFGRREISARWTRIFADRILKIGEDDAPDESAVAKAVSTAIAPFEANANTIVQAVLAVK